MNTTLTVSPALPNLPINLRSAEHDSFETMCAPLSFFWLARAFHLSGNKEKKNKLEMRIRHLTKLYEFPDNLFEQLVSFGDDKNVDWSPRVPEVIGVRALQRQLGLGEQEYRILAFAFLSTHSRFIGALRDFIEHTFCNESQLDVICKLTGIDRSQFPILTNDQSTIVQMHLSGPGPYSFGMSVAERFYMHDDVLSQVLKAKSIDDDILAGLLNPCEPAKLTIDDFKHIGEQLQLLKDCVMDATANGGKPLSVLLVGKPGSGKTQLVKALSAYAEASLYEVPVVDDDTLKKGNSAYRLGEYLRMSNMLNRAPTCHILFDEVEDVLNERENENKRKGWINQTLEKRSATTFWVCNTVEHFDQAFLRRFDYVLYMPVLDYRSRVRMMKDAFAKHGVSSQRIHELAAQRINTPAAVERLANLAERLKGGQLSANEMLNMNFPTAPNWYSKELGEFNLNHCHADTPIPLEQLASLCEKNANIRVLVSGGSGSGKTSLVRHLCYEYNQSTRFYEAESLITPDPVVFFNLVQNAFEHAAIKREMLVIDEVDQLLSTTLRVMPNPSSFYRWLAKQIREFHYPLFMTLSDERALQDYPLIQDAFDATVQLKAWPTKTLTHYAKEFANANELSTESLTVKQSATPQRFIQALRQCRLHEDMNQLNAALQDSNDNTIGFLARVS